MPASFERNLENARSSGGPWRRFLPRFGESAEDRKSGETGGEPWIEKVVPEVGGFESCEAKCPDAEEKREKQEEPAPPPREESDERERDEKSTDAAVVAERIGIEGRDPESHRVQGESARENERAERPKLLPVEKLGRRPPRMRSGAPS